MSWGTKFPRLHQRRLRSACASSVPSDQRFCCAFYGLLCTKHVNQFVSKFYSSTVSTNIFMSSITYTFVKCSYTNYFFLSSANLICRSTDISKYFRESLGIRDNESRLYMHIKGN